MKDQNYSVLMVDDDEDDIFAVRRGFSNAETKIDFEPFSEAEKLFDYLDSIGRPQPDLILLDVNMPRMNGFEVLSHLKSVELWAPIPVIILSTSAHEADRTKAKQLGAVDFETKFSSMKMLDKWVKRVEKFLATQP